MRFWVATVGFAALLSLVPEFSASAQGTDPGRVHTQSGQDLGAINLRDITETESGVRFTEAADVQRRQAQTLLDRFVEVLVLRNNAVLVLTKVMHRMTFGPANYDPAPTSLNTIGRIAFLTEQGFVFDEHAIKRAGLIAYEVQASKTATCFVFAAFLGDGIELTRELHGYVCYRLADRTAETLEREMLILLSRARFAKSSDASDFSVTLEIPAARLAALPTHDADRATLLGERRL
jgi:hypothetical protein